MNNFIYYLASLIIAFFFILLGFTTLFLPSNEEGLKAISDFILNNYWITYLISALFILIGVAILFSIKSNISKQYYRMRSGECHTFIDEKIFEQYIDTYWKELFPNQQIPSKVMIKKNKLYITADLPPIALTEQRTLLQQIENDLNEILMKYLGYHQEYIISISFKPETSN